MVAEPATTQPTEQSVSAPKRLIGFQKAAIVSVVLVAILVVGVVASMSYNPSRTAPAPTPPTPSWHTVTGFSHKSNLNDYDYPTSNLTEPFNIVGSQFRLQWDYQGRATPTLVFAMFGIFVYHKGDTVNYIDRFCYDSNPYDTACSPAEFEMNGTEYIHNGRGAFQLDVVFSSLTDWSITVEDYY